MTNHSLLHLYNGYVKFDSANQFVTRTFVIGTFLSKTNMNSIPREVGYLC
jgi:hypothetical protein